MIKVGIVDFDTSHVVAFTQRMNHVDVEEEQWVEGAKVVAGCPADSKHSPDMLRRNSDQLKRYGVDIVESPEDLLGSIDAVCIEANDGSVHLQRAKPFIEAGLPCFIDKPFETDLGNAREIVRLARKNSVPVFSASYLRYAPELQEVISDPEVGGIVGASAYSPGTEHPVNPGLFNYGIHAVETLYSLLGPGCRKVTNVYTEGAEVVTGVWKDERVGEVRATRSGSHSYGYIAWGEKSVRQSVLSARYIYRELLKQIIRMFETGEPPIDPDISVEIVAFIIAALDSRNRGGKMTPLDI